MPMEFRFDVFISYSANDGIREADMDGPEPLSSMQ
jgi:hypothetical protein